MEKPCLQCNKTIIKPVNESVRIFKTRRKYCSTACMDEYRRGKPSCSPETAFQKGHTLYSEVDTRRKRTGEENNKWKGGVTPEHEKIRKSNRYIKWRQRVFERDDWTCQDCGKRGNGTLHADHVLPFSLFPELRFDELNGRTLCKPCHRKTPTYGKFDKLLVTGLLGLPQEALEVQ